MLPGSHRTGEREHGEGGVATAGDEVWAASGLRCGDALLFHSLTLHRALDNVTADRLRLSADYRFEAAT